jgi:multisubunit Na+/H+ antiporter MnhB subunit
MSEPGQLRQSSTRVMSLVMIVIGVALIIRTISAGGGGLAVGVLLGVLFVCAGAGRLYLHGRRR